MHSVEKVNVGQERVEVKMEGKVSVKVQEVMALCSQIKTGS